MRSLVDVYRTITADVLHAFFVQMVATPKRNYVAAVAAAATQSAWPLLQACRYVPWLRIVVRCMYSHLASIDIRRLTSNINWLEMPDKEVMGRHSHANRSEDNGTAKVIEKRRNQFLPKYKEKLDAETLATVQRIKRQHQ